jgi:hypothetical protein
MLKQWFYVPIYVKMKKNNAMNVPEEPYFRLILNQIIRNLNNSSYRILHS